MMLLEPPLILITEFKLYSPRTWLEIAVTKIKKERKKGTAAAAVRAMILKLGNDRALCQKYSLPLSYPWDKAECAREKHKASRQMHISKVSELSLSPRRSSFVCVYIYIYRTRGVVHFSDKQSRERRQKEEKEEDEKEKEEQRERGHSAEQRKKRCYLRARNHCRTCERGSFCISKRKATCIHEVAGRHTRIYVYGAFRGCVCMRSPVNTRNLGSSEKEVFFSPEKGLRKLCTRERELGVTAIAVAAGGEIFRLCFLWVRPRCFRRMTIAVRNPA